MRKAPNLRAEKFRVGGDPNDGNNGQFSISGDGISLKIQVSDGAGWDHVSVSLKHRCPTWEEMESVRKLFFRDDEWAIQYGTPRAAHISHHDYCLHWWRPQCETLPRPPAFMVGPTPELMAVARSLAGDLLPWEQMEAINLLMDAAPDLYAACGLALPHVVNVVAADAIRAALAKAKQG